MTEPDEVKRNRQEKRRNMLNGIAELPPETPIYRVYRLRYLLRMLRSRRNVLVKPRMWDDPFENPYFQKSSFMLGSEQVESSAYVRERFYGQCWTLNREETDALWRIYSPYKDGVRVRSTIGRLFGGLYQLDDWRAWISYFIGRVSYYKETEMLAVLRQGIDASALVDSRWTASTLLLKRKEFAHENEVRLLHIDYGIKRAQRNDTYSYRINPNKAFSEILFDPRIDPRDFERYRRIIGALGFFGTIAQSRLYRMPTVIARVRKRTRRARRDIRSDSVVMRAGA